MAKDYSRFSFRDLLSIIWGTIRYGIYGAILCVALRVAFGVAWFFGVQAPVWVVVYLYSDRRAISIVLAVAIVGGVVTIFRIASRISRIRRAAAEKIEQERSQRIHELISSANSACLTSTRSFSELPTSLSNAQSWIPEAQQHFQNNAYSPFWRAIEQAYNCLGWYKRHVVLIDQSSRNYSKASSAYANGGGTDPLPQFPLDPNLRSTTHTAEGIAQKLSKLVYEAQRDAVFTQVWEQRRLAEADIQGFPNLESAVNNLPSALNETHQLLNTSLASFGYAALSVDDTHEPMPVSDNSSLTIEEKQLELQQDLFARVEKAVSTLTENRAHAIGIS